MVDDDARGGLAVLWFKVESKMAAHRKTRLISRDRVEVPLRTAAMGAWWFAACWAAGNETDGFVPAEVIEQFDPDGILTQALIDCNGEDGCGYFEVATVGGERGFILHDWLDVQRSRAEMDADREFEAERKRKARAAKAARRGGPAPDDDGPDGGSRVDVQDAIPGVLPDGVPVVVPVGQPEGRRNGQRPDDDRTPDGNPAIVRSIEQSRAEQIELPARQARSPRTAARPDDPPGFAEWYAAYPRHVARGAARKAYATALRKTSRSVLVEAALRFARKVEHDRTPADKRPYPATWLNAEQWLDEPDRLVASGILDY